MKKTIVVNSSESQAQRLDEVGRQIVLLIQKVDRVEQLYAIPGENEWSVMQIIGHMVEMIPHWMNYCQNLITTDVEPPLFGHELDAPERIEGTNRGEAGELIEIASLLKQEICTAA